MLWAGGLWERPTESRSALFEASRKLAGVEKPKPTAKLFHSEAPPLNGGYDTDLNTFSRGPFNRGYDRDNGK